MFIKFLLLRYTPSPLFYFLFIFWLCWINYWAKPSPQVHPCHYLSPPARTHTHSILIRPAKAEHELCLSNLQPHKTTGLSSPASHQQKSARETTDKVWLMKRPSNFYRKSSSLALTRVCEMISGRIGLPLVFLPSGLFLPCDWIQRCLAGNCPVPDKQVITVDRIILHFNFVGPNEILRESCVRKKTKSLCLRSVVQQRGK